MLVPAAAEGVVGTMVTMLAVLQVVDVATTSYMVSNVVSSVVMVNPTKAGEVSI